MSHFEFNPQERNFPIYGAAERSYPVEEPIDYRLWIVELIYVYSIGKEMILNEEVDLKVFRTAYRQWVAAKNCLLYTSPSPRDRTRSRMPSSA